MKITRRSILAGFAGGAAASIAPDLAQADDGKELPALIKAHSRACDAATKASDDLDRLFYGACEPDEIMLPATIDIGVSEPLIAEYLLTAKNSERLSYKGERICRCGRWFFVNSLAEARVRLIDYYQSRKRDFEAFQASNSDEQLRAFRVHVMNKEREGCRKALAVAKITMRRHRKQWESSPHGKVAMRLEQALSDKESTLSAVLEYPCASLSDHKAKSGFIYARFNDGPMKPENMAAMLKGMSVSS